jgi:hypothetical protein
MSYSITVIGLALCLSACASGSSGGASASRDVLTQAQLAETGQTNAYDAIRRLQPRWLRTGMSVYIDGSAAAGGREAGRDEGADYLRTLHVTSIREMRYLDPRLASIRYGMGMGVVIEVTLVR